MTDYLIHIAYASDDESLAKKFIHAALLELEGIDIISIDVYCHETEYPNNHDWIFEVFIKTELSEKNLWSAMEQTGLHLTTILQSGVDPIYQETKQTGETMSL